MSMLDIVAFIAENINMQIWICLESSPIFVNIILQEMEEYWRN